jgi:hypothetical protein
MLLACVLALASPALAADVPPGTPTVAVAAASTWLPGYDAIRVALVADDGPAATTAARSLASTVAGDPPLAEAADAVATSVDATARRAAFAQLSKLVVLRLSAPGSPKVLVYHCPMFTGFAYWIQPRAGIANPYMGSAMPECGEEVSMKVAAKAAAAG